jgi:CRP/FNR family cyclic AMP-dependent transcriptional regulator
VSFPILGSLNEEERRKVLASTRRRRFGRREVLFHEGDPGDTQHLVDKGRLAIRITTPLGDVATVDVMSRGDVVGVFAVLEEGGRRTATVQALEPTETLTLDRAQFLELRRAHPAVDRFLIDVLANHVRRVDAQLMEALFVPVERRLVRRLMTLAEVYGPNATEIEIPFTQEDLASLAGTSRATANRVLRQLEEGGVVSLSRGRIRVLDVAAVAKRAR